MLLGLYKLYMQVKAQLLVVSEWAWGPLQSTMGESRVRSSNVTPSKVAPLSDMLAIVRLYQ
jgi:hypothetical protein